MDPVAKAAAGSPEANLDPRQRLEARKRLEAIRGFEEMFLTEMFKAMRRTVPEGDDSSQARKMWRDRFDQEVAKRISEAGGIGLAPLLEQGISTLSGKGKR